MLFPYIIGTRIRLKRKENGYTLEEAAQNWGITERRVQVLCLQGKIEGVVRLGWAWAIP